jgi:hypothetical protein
MIKLTTLEYEGREVSFLARDKEEIDFVNFVRKIIDYTFYPLDKSRYRKSVKTLDIDDIYKILDLTETYGRPYLVRIAIALSPLYTSRISCMYDVELASCYFILSDIFIPDIAGIIMTYLSVDDGKDNQTLYCSVCDKQLKNEVNFENHMYSIAHENNVDRFLSIMDKAPRYIGWNSKLTIYRRVYGKSITT